MTSFFRNLAVVLSDKKQRILLMVSKKHECVNKQEIQTEVAIVTPDIKSPSIQKGEGKLG